MACLCGEGPVTSEELDNGCDVLLLGLEGSGKTQLAKRLQVANNKRAAGELLVADGARVAADTVPTIGTEFFEVALWKGAPFKRLLIREVGGQMCPIWPQYFNACGACVVYVVDAADAGMLAPAAVELFELLKDDQLAEKPLCVVLTKMDLPGALSRSELEMVLQLTDLERTCRPGRLCIVEASGVDVQGWEDQAEQLLKWAVGCKEHAVAMQER